MKRTAILLFLLMLLPCIGTTAAPKTAPQAPAATSQTVTIDRQVYDSFIQAQQDAHIKELIAEESKTTDQQLNNQFSKYIDESVNRFNMLSIIIGILTLIVGILGVAFPIIINRGYRNKAKEVQAEIKETAAEAKKSQEAAEQSQKEIAEAEKRSRAITYFFQALAEKYPHRGIDLYTKAIELNPQYAAAYTNRGIANRRLRQDQKAIEDFNKVIELTPQDAEAYYNRGITYRKIKRFKQAILDLNKSTELDPSSPWPHNGLAYVYLDQKKYAQALDEINIAINMVPDHPYFYDTRADIYMDMKDYDNAQKDCEKALPINQDAYVEGLLKDKLRRIEEIQNGNEPKGPNDPNTPEPPEPEPVLVPVTPKTPSGSDSQGATIESDNE